MKPNQTAELTNSIIKELVGETDLVANDLSNIIDIGKSIQDVVSMDNFVGALVAKIGKTVFDVVPYRSIGPDIKKDSFDWGNIVEKVKFDGIEFRDTEKFKLNQGDPLPLAKYEPASAEAIYFQNRDTASLEITLPAKTREFAGYFKDSNTYNRFVSAIHEVIYNALSQRNDAVAISTFNRFIVDTLVNEKTTTKIGLLSEYNEQYGVTLEKAKALTTPEFLQYAIGRINGIYGDMGYTSTLFNLNGRKTNSYGRTAVTVLKGLEEAFRYHLLPDIYNDNLLTLPGYNTTPVWQGYGLDGTFDTKSTVKMLVDDEETTFSGILAVAYDKDALGIYNEEVDSRMQENGPTGLVNLFYDVSISNYNDHDRNFVVFTLD